VWRPIHLIVPPSTYNPQRNYDVYRQTPLEGVTSIALVLKAAGYEVSVLDTRDMNDPLGWLISQIDHDSFFVGMTTFFNSFRFIKEFSVLFKKEFPQIPLVIGGPMATAAYRQFLTWTDVDIIVLGEGEKTVTELASRFEKNKDPFSTPGIGYRTKSGVYQVNPVWQATAVSSGKEASRVAQHTLQQQPLTPSAIPQSFLRRSQIPKESKKSRRSLLTEEPPWKLIPTPPCTVR
jgi:radical SAM superfamily enzyme YgiQ (UPF0313 family)